MADDVWSSQLRKGVIELAILALVAEEPRYGSQLVERLSAEPALSVTAGTAYPLLARLARAGLVAATWQESPVGPPRKYYSLTEAGSALLPQMSSAFRQVSAAVESLLPPATGKANR